MEKTGTRPSKGLVFYCPVCGAEVSVVGVGKGGRLCPRCCNTDMLKRGVLPAFFYCPNCGSELMMLVDGGGNTAPVCCNVVMKRTDLGELS